MGVSSLIDLEQTQEENQRKRGNSEAGLLSDVLFTPAALIFLNPKDSPWAAAPGQDTGTARSPTDTWSGHRDSPQPLQTPGQDTGTARSPTDTWSGHRDSPQPYRHAFSPIWLRGHACLQGWVSSHGTAQGRPGGPSHQPREEAPGGRGWVLATHSWYSGIAASPSPPRACVTGKAFHSDPSIHHSHFLDV